MRKTITILFILISTLSFGQGSFFSRPVVAAGGLIDKDSIFYVLRGSDTLEVFVLNSKIYFRSDNSIDSILFIKGLTGNTSLKSNIGGGGSYSVNPPLLLSGTIISADTTTGNPHLATQYYVGSHSGITSLNGLTGATQTFATGTTGTDFGIVSSGTAHTFNIPTASASNRGLTSTTDWSTFNNKQATISVTSPILLSGTTIKFDTTTGLFKSFFFGLTSTIDTTHSASVSNVTAGSGITITTEGKTKKIAATNSGTITSVATASPLSGGTITSTGTISLDTTLGTFGSKYIGKAVNSGRLIVGNASNVGIAQTMSGDMTISGTAVTTLATAYKPNGNNNNIQVNRSSAMYGTDSLRFGGNGTFKVQAGDTITMYNSNKGSYSQIGENTYITNDSTVNLIAETANGGVAMQLNGDLSSSKGTFTNICNDNGSANIMTMTQTPISFNINQTGYTGGLLNIASTNAANGVVDLGDYSSTVNATRWKLDDGNQDISWYSNTTNINSSNTNINGQLDATGLTAASVNTLQDGGNPSTGTTVTISNSTLSHVNYNINNAATIAALTVNLPTTPTNFQTVTIYFLSKVTTLTITPTGGAAVSHQPTTVAAGQCMTFIYDLNGVIGGHTTTWQYMGGATNYTAPLSASSTLNFPSTAAGASSDLTITLSGAATSDPVILGVDNASTQANSSYSAWVSAANTVKVRFINSQLVGAIDPASGTFTVKILQ